MQCATGQWYTDDRENGMSWKGYEKPPQCVRCQLLARDLCFVRAAGPTCPKASRCDEIVDHDTRLEHDWVKAGERPHCLEPIAFFNEAGEFERYGCLLVELGGEG